MTDTKNNAAFDLRYNLVAVTKYRKKVLTPDMRAYIHEVAAELFASWECCLLECNGEEDHMHFLFSAHPVLELSKLVNSFKTVTARKTRKKYARELAKVYRKPVLWHGAYYISTVGNVSLDTIKRYIEKQGQGRWPNSNR